MTYPILAIKLIWIFFWLAFMTITLFFPITIFALLGKNGTVAFHLMRFWCWVVLTMAGGRSSIRGKEKIKKGQTYIVISNHQSHFDIPTIFTTLGIQFRFIIKKELLKIPLFGYALYAARHVFIDRSNREKSIESINKGIERLPKGVGLIFFAEGTRSPDGEIHEFKKGGFIISLQRNIPILPITVNGSRRFLPRDTWNYHPGKMEVVIGDPIDPSRYAEMNIMDLIKKTRETVVSNFNPDFGK